MEVLPLGGGEFGTALLWREKSLESDEREELGIASSCQRGTARGDKLAGFVVTSL